MSTSLPTDREPTTSSVAATASASTAMAVLRIRFARRARAFLLSFFLGAGFFGPGCAVFVRFAVPGALVFVLAAARAFVPDAAAAPSAFAARDAAALSFLMRLMAATSCAAFTAAAVSVSSPAAACPVRLDAAPVTRPADTIQSGASSPSPMTILRGGSSCAGASSSSSSCGITCLTRLRRGVVSSGMHVTSSKIKAGLLPLILIAYHFISYFIFSRSARMILRCFARAYCLCI